VNFCLSDRKANRPRAGKLPDFDDIHCQNIVTLAMPGLGSYVARCNRTEIKLDPAFGPVKASWDREYTGRSDETRWLRASAEISIETVTVGGHGEFDADGLKSGGVSVGVGAGRGKELGQGVKAGPLEIAAQAGVEVGAGVSVEFDRGGVTDIAVSAKAEAKVGNTVGKSDADGAKGGASIGGESRWGWNSGYSGGVSGKFDAGVF
jgi:chorismate synthase